MFYNIKYNYETKTNYMNIINNIHIKWDMVKLNITIYNKNTITITKDSLKDFSDGSLIVLYVYDGKNNKLSNYKLVEQYGLSYNFKTRDINDFLIHSLPYKILYIIKPNSYEDFSNYSFFVPSMNGQVLTSSNIEGIEFKILDGSTFNFEQYLPQISIDNIDTVSNDGTTIKANLSYNNKSLLTPTKVYIDNNAGYISKSSVISSNGVVSTKLLPLGLESGDEITLKFGYRHYTNISNITVKVV